MSLFVNNLVNPCSLLHMDGASLSVFYMPTILNLLSFCSFHLN
jgi:hypothetical protein